MNLVYGHSHVATIIPAVFGPERWSIKACRVLGMTERQVHRIVRGDRAFRSRHLAIIESYLDNRSRALGAETKLAIARVLKAEKQTRQGLSAARQAITAHKAEKKRLAGR